MLIKIQKDTDGTMAVYTKCDKGVGGKSSFTTGVTPETLESVVAKHLQDARPFEQLDFPAVSQESA